MLLADANTWPTWGALRERVLTACKEVDLAHMQSPFMLIRQSSCPFTCKDTGSYLQPVPSLARLHWHPQIKIVNTASLRDAFCNEIVKLSPLELWHMDFHGSSNLRNFVLSPSTACSKLTELDLSDCRSLNYVLIQSESLTTIKLHKCIRMNKALQQNWAALIQCAQQVPIATFVLEFVHAVALLVCFAKRGYTYT
eukprot:436503-Pelagomonas_calceolata.AAC.2